MSILGKYTIVETLQQRPKGSVYIARNESRIDQQSVDVIVKTFKKTKSRYFIEDNNYQDKIPKELFFNNLIKNKSVCPLIFESVDAGDEYVVVMEYLHGAWIDLFFYTDVPRQEKTLRKILRNLVEVLQDLAKEGVYHLDIKPENIMVNQKTLSIKLLDFEDAFIDKDRCDPTHNKPAGTTGYAAPEVIQGLEYDVKQSIVYSLGSLMFTCIESFIADLDANKNINLKFRKSSFEAREFIKTCMRQCPKERIGFDALLEESFLN